MNILLRLCLVVVILNCCVFVAHLRTQTLTRVVDASNPVVSDHYESGGGSWIDVNRDGYLDLFVAHGNLSNQNNSLYLNNRAGGYIKVSTGAIVTDGGSSIGSTWGDFNNDGKLDVFVTNRNSFGNFLYLGNGDSTFTKITTGPVVTDIANSNSGTWVDVDGDGYLDLYVVNFQGNDYFYKNNGPPLFDFTRIDTILPVGDGTNFSIPGAWADMNNDRRPDLYVGNAGSQNDNLYLNNGNLQFNSVVVPDGKSTLGASWGDYDNDGNLDLVVVHYSGQNNSLYHNSGSPSYSLSLDTGSIVSKEGGNGVGSSWGDFNNDGNLDLFVANDGGQSHLYINNGPPNYTFTAVTVGDPVTNVGNSFGCVWVDYDQDGFLDLFVANRLNQQNFLYHNGGNANHWVELDLTGTVSNRTAIGATVRIKATINGTPRWQMREVPGQTGYNSQVLTLHFGLGDATTIDSMKVEWPSGNDEVFTTVAANQHLYIAENDSSVPALTQPVAGAQQVIRPVRFEWSHFIYNAPYWLQVSSDSTFSSSFLVNDSTIADTFKTFSLTAGAGKVFWRVRSARSIYKSRWSDVSSFTFGDTLYQLNVSNRWNLLSLPVSPDDARKSVLFPTAQSSAYRYNNGYVAAETLAAGVGYWLKFSGNQSVQYIGTSVHVESLQVVKGWNLIGTIMDTIDASSISTNPSGIINSAFYRYRNGYKVADTLVPGEGYWVKASSAGTIVIGPSGGHAIAKRDDMVDELQKLNRLTIEDTDGNTQVLFYGSTGHDGDFSQLEEMPPPVPGGLDVRFGTSSMVEMFRAGEEKRVPVTILSASYPLKLRWEASATEDLTYRLNVGVHDVTLSGEGSYSVLSPGIQGSIVLSSDGVHSISHQFSLQQSYPNPFNPATVIRYNLPVDSHVTLEVFNILGEKIRTLVEGKQERGEKSVQFDAGDLPSGIYFYKISVADNSAHTSQRQFVDVKKMVLIR